MDLARGREPTISGLFLLLSTRRATFGSSDLLGCEMVQKIHFSADCEVLFSANISALIITMHSGGM